jgi:hypothetical protein
MDYIYSGEFSIIDKIKFKDYNLSQETIENNDIIDEIIKHINIYNDLYYLSNKISLHDLNAIQINEEIVLCDNREDNKKQENTNEYKLLIYIIFLTKSKITIQEKEIETNIGTIIIFPTEWFFYFKLTQCKIIIGNVYEFKD